jgi:hypothetical protein
MLFQLLTPQKAIHKALVTIQVVKVLKIKNLNSFEL